MKKIILISMMLFSVICLFAQEDQPGREYRRQEDIKTIFPQGRRGAVGGYGELSMLYSSIDQRDALTFGARGAVLLGHSIALGISGSGFINDPKAYTEFSERVSITGGYGGIFFEPIILPRFPVHVAIPVTVGVGGVSVARIYEYNDYDDYYPEESDAYLVVEPGIELELNITRFCRFSIGCYYRYTTDVEMTIDGVVLPGNLLQGFSGGVNFKFGKF